MALGLLIFRKFYFKHAGDELVPVTKKNFMLKVDQVEYLKVILPEVIQCVRAVTVTPELYRNPEQCASQNRRDPSIWMWRLSVRKACVT